MQDLTANLVQQVEPTRLEMPLPSNLISQSCSAPYAHGIASFTLTNTYFLHYVDCHHAAVG